MSGLSFVARAATFPLIITSSSLAALSLSWAQSPAPPPPRGEPELLITVTANRSPTDIQRTGSAITVLSAEDIRAINPGSFADLLRQVPGLSLTENGGAGGTASVRLRGNDSRHTLVLVDGVRVTDPTNVGGGYDFSMLSPVDIERIEVLRGPQSALYGSDAIGGVINIITRKGRGEPKAYIQTEGGSYGSRSLRASVSGGTQTLSYAFSFTQADSAGFSRFGYRVPRIERTRLTALEPDGFSRSGASGRIAWRPFQGFELEVGGQFTRTLSQTDNAFGLAEDTAGKDRLKSGSGYAKASLDTLEGQWKHSVTLFTSLTERRSRCAAFGFNCFVQDAGNQTNFTGYDIADTAFRGIRQGVEYQGDIRLGAFGTMIVGARHEREQALFSATGLAPVLTPGYENSATRTTNSLFALHQIDLGARTSLSFGGRMDAPDDTRRFYTWRATVAHRILETGTKLRASVGTGAKAPSLYQQFSAYGPLASGVRALRPERSFGIDAGFDQDLFDGRVKLSATVYQNRLRDVIEYDAQRGLINTVFFPFTFPIGQYVNLSRAVTQGVELSGSMVLVEGLLRARGSFAWQDARNQTAFGTLRAGDKLLRRPEQQGYVALTFTPIAGLSIEPNLTFVGRQVDQVRLPGTFNSFRRDLAPYGLLGLRIDYAATTQVSLYARAENLTNAKYQEVFNYGTAGRSFYSGIRATW